MSGIYTQKTPLKRFQRDAIENATQILRTCLSELKQVGGTRNYATSRNTIVADLGAVLFEAPTGAGKTLMAGSVAEAVSQLHSTCELPKVVWFWFAPFSGLIDQAIRTIKTEFDTLRPKRPTVDREPTDLRSGDVFVTTWASVATKQESSRKIRTATEVMPSIDDLISYARAQGFAVGVVIDEAHHSIPGQTQAFAFYKNVLAPELTVLVTATPRDKDVEIFKRAAGITHLRRASVSREEAIGGRLIKEGVKVAVFKPGSDVEDLINFKRTALRQAVETNNRLKAIMKDEGLAITPLLLVQVEDGEDTVEEAVQWLKELGFRAEGESAVVRSHTAKEPDPYFLSIATDESVEALVFKMSVATGFDAPRAFTLVSFRPSRDEDFGVQIVGRILRVDRRLQMIKNLPPALNHGYVFLSDRAGQSGLLSAAQRINAVKTELASVVSSFAIVAIGSNEPTPQLTHHGQTSFVTSSGREGAVLIGDSAAALPVENSSAGHHSTQEAAFDTLQGVLFEEWDLTLRAQECTEQHTEKPKRKISGYTYPLDAGLGAPKAFRRAIIRLESDDIIREIVSLFRFDGDALMAATQNAAQIIMEEVEIFGSKKERVERIEAELAQKEIDAHAQKALFTQADDQGVIDGRELHQALMEQLRKEVACRGMTHLFDTEEKLRCGLHKILALRPLELRRAVSEALAKHTTSEEAAALPTEIIWPEPLDPSLLNLYRVFPGDFDSKWEREFAEYLDNDQTGMVLWWHRNPVRKPFSVKVPLPRHPDFHPDFVVGIKNRRSGNGILLVETKRDINDPKGNAQVKAQAKHPDYGNIMMIYWEENREWQVVEYDPRKDKNYLNRVLRPELFPDY